MLVVAFFKYGEFEEATLGFVWGYYSDLARFDVYIVLNDIIHARSSDFIICSIHADS